MDALIYNTWFDAVEKKECMPNMKELRPELWLEIISGYFFGGH